MTVADNIVTAGQSRLPDHLGGISIGQLAQLWDREKGAPREGHPLTEMVEIECHGRPNLKAHGERQLQCPNGSRFKVMRYFAPLTACDYCVEEGKKELKIEGKRLDWEKICPEAFRQTDKNHPSFPKAQYASTAEYSGGESLLLFGPSRTGKSRLAMMLLKRCLVRFDKTVQAYWEEDLEDAKNIKTDRKRLIAEWGKPSLILLDDALLTGAKDERIGSFLKQLIDYRMRANRHTIITSQVGGDDYKEAAKRDGLLKQQDEARLDALLNRVRESFRIVPFVEVKPAAGEQAF